MPKMHLLLADENFSQQAVKELKRLGHDLVTLVDLGLADMGYPDDAVLAKATELSRCVLTFNRRDFIKLHKRNSDHAGIIVCTLNPDKARLAGKINQAIGELDDLRGLLIRVYRD